MSQITCCPSCGTKFKVVADQLRISEGWVRCGHCKEIFDATAHLLAVAAPESLLPEFPLDQGQEPRREPPPSAPIATATPVASGPAMLEVPNPRVPAFLETSAPEPGLLHDAEAVFRWPDREAQEPADAAALPDALPQGLAPLPQEVVRVDERVAEVPPEPAPEPQPVSALEPPLELSGYELPFAELRDEATDEPQNPEEDAQRLPENDDALGAATDVPDMPVEDSLGGAAAPMVLPLRQASDEEEDELPQLQPVPGFVRAARRKAFWHSAGVRVLLLLLGLVLAGAMAAQIALHERDYLAAWEPRLRPLLSTACAALDCTIGPRRDIAAVVIDSSGFSKAARGDAYQLSLTLKNRAVTAVALPAVELTLTDAQEQVVLRRVLLPAEFGAPAELAAQGEWSGNVSVVLAGPALKLAGYRVLAFYP